MMIVRLNIGQKLLGPADYFKSQKDIENMHKGMSIFEAYRRWNCPDLFSSSFKANTSSVAVLHFEMMRSQPITDVIESKTTLRFPAQKKKQIDLSFSSNSQKVTSEDPTKKKIINLISRSNKLDPDSVVPSLRTWVSETYGELEYE